MLDFLRRKAQSPYLQGTVVCIVLVFIFWGVGSYQKGGRNAVATVNGQDVSFEEYRRAYETAFKNFKEQTGRDVPENLIQDGSFKGRVVDELVQTVLLRQGARELGIFVTDAELQEKIQAMEAFRSNGVFDMQRYRNLLAGSRMSTSDFEASLRNDLLTAKVLARLSGFAVATPREIEDRYHYARDEIKLGYMRIGVSQYRDKVEVTDEALTQYLLDNQDSHMTPRQIKLSYLVFPFAEFGKGVELAAGAVEAYYDEHRAEYDLPEKRHARHILIRTPPGSEDKTAARKKADDILARLRKGEDFATLAGQYSEDSSAARGGDLGFFGRGQMVQPFEEAVFGLKPGEVSEVVETQFGFHIVKLEEIQAAQVKTVEQVRPEIEEKLKLAQGRGLAFKMAGEAYEQIIMAGSLAAYGEKSGTGLLTTGMFSQREPEKALAEKRQLLQAAFQLKKGELSSLVEGGAEYAILFVEDEKAPELPELAAVRERVEREYVGYQARKMATEAARAVLAALKEGGDRAELAKEHGVEIKDTGYLSRLSNSPKGLPEQMIAQGFGLTQANPYPENVFTQLELNYVFWLDSLRPTDLTFLAAGQEAINTELLREKREGSLVAWLSGLRQTAKIKINQKLL